MGKSLLLFLSLLCGIGCCFCQSPAQRPPAATPCFTKSYQDSLVKHYLEEGAQRYGYTHPNWEKYCDSLLALCPNLAVAYREKAIPYLKMGQWAQAMPLEDSAVRYDAKTWLAYRGFIKCIFTKDYPGALLDLQAAEKQLPQGFEMDHSYAFFQALCYAQLNRLPEAEQCLKRDIQLQEKMSAGKSVHFNSWLYAGILQLRQQRYAPARGYLQKCLGAYPNHPEAHYYLALTYWLEGNAPEARQHLTRAQQSLQQGYGLNEDNVYYVNYPYQITPHEVETAERRWSSQPDPVALLQAL